MAIYLTYLNSLKRHFPVGENKSVALLETCSNLGIWTFWLERNMVISRGFAWFEQYCGTALHLWHEGFSMLKLHQTARFGTAGLKTPIATN